MLTRLERKALMEFAKCDRGSVNHDDKACSLAGQMLYDLGMLDQNSDWAVIAESLAMDGLPVKEGRDE